MRSVHALPPQACEREEVVHVLHRRGKLLSLAMLVALLGAGLLNGGLASAASPAPGTPFKAIPGPSPVVLTANGGRLSATFLIGVIGAGPADTVALSDSLSPAGSGSGPCAESINGIAIPTVAPFSVNVTADANGRVEAVGTLSNCSTNAPGVYTISAADSNPLVLPVSPTIATYALEGPRP